MRTILLLISISYSTLCSAWKILADAPMPDEAFTQGLDYENGQFFISSGLYGKSFLVRQAQNERDGSVQALPPSVFAEGLVYLDHRLYLLTWRAGLLLTFNADNLMPINQTRYRGEGWGLTHDGDHFVMSDGSDQLQFRRTRDFQLLRTLSVHHHSKPLSRINELEFARGRIWANVWHDDRIFEIDKQTGAVLATYDFSELRSRLQLKDPEAVLNGIAYDSERDAFWITGKLWPRRYLVQMGRDKADSDQPSPTPAAHQQ